MLDIRTVREQPDFVESRLALRCSGDEEKIDELLRVDAERRKAETALQALNAERKKLSKEIGGMRSRGQDSLELENRVRKIGEEIARLNEDVNLVDGQQKEMLLEIPNLPHLKVPIGKDASANPVVRSWGAKPNLDSPLDHVTIETNLKLFDLERAAKLSGSGFICFTGAGARLERSFDPVHARFAHARAWLRRNEPAVFGAARMHDRNIAAAEIRSRHMRTGKLISSFSPRLRKCR